MKSIKFGGAPLDLDRSKGEPGSDASDPSRYLPRTPYPRKVPPPTPSPRSASSPCATPTPTRANIPILHDDAAPAAAAAIASKEQIRSQLMFDIYPDEQAQGEIARFLRENLTAAIDGVEEEESSDQEAKIGIEYDCELLSLDDEMEWHRVHPISLLCHDHGRSNLSEEEPWCSYKTSLNAPDRVQARLIRVYVPLGKSYTSHLPSPRTPASSASTCRQPQKQPPQDKEKEKEEEELDKVAERCEEVIRRFQSEVLRRHDILDTAVDVYLLSQQSCCLPEEEEAKGDGEGQVTEHGHEPGRSCRRKLRFPPEQVWYRGIDTGSPMKMDGDVLERYLRSELDWLDVREEVRENGQGDDDAQGVVQVFPPPAETLDDIIEE
ncbi:hypothetical protein F5Y17DRAFT_432939 [Xylariaceae sp. FL0594]|nr:hypothetical protein F5Y17DRAFT_432939 [Xylariaceae sp. FL0594]